MSFGADEEIKEQQPNISKKDSTAVCLYEAESCSNDRPRMQSFFASAIYVIFFLFIQLFFSFQIFCEIQLVTEWLNKDTSFDVISAPTK